VQPPQLFDRVCGFRNHRPSSTAETDCANDVIVDRWSHPLIISRGIESPLRRPSILSLLFAAPQIETTEIQITRSPVFALGLIVSLEFSCRHHGGLFLNRGCVSTPTSTEQKKNQGKNIQKSKKLYRVEVVLL
jgi:hypothetical protein